MSQPENHPGLRAAADALAVARIVAGPPVAAYIALTAPEERSWKVGAATAAVASTDLLDGWLARKAGTTARGGWLDQMADKAFVLPGMVALSFNGELPAIYPAEKLVRDVGVTALRRRAASRGKNVDAGLIGKRKTFAQMAALSAGASPLAQQPGLLRRGFSNAAALSLTSFGDYLMDYTSPGDKRSKKRAHATTRNSKAREVSAGRVGKLIKFVDQKLPFVQPDHLTALGMGLVISSERTVLKKPDKATLSTVVYTIGGLLDALDGSLAREKSARRGKEPTTRGMLTDVLSDKFQEIVTFGALSLIAKKRGNDVAADNYAVAAMTAVLPALFRAEAETQGIIVAEGGIGTRVGRGILGGVGLGLNRHENTSDIVSAVVANNNIVTAIRRHNVVGEREKSSHYKGSNNKRRFKHDALSKRRVLVPMAAAGAAAGAALLATRRKTS
jgi:phosphatidylglycerophosphate synthase